MFESVVGHKNARNESMSVDTEQIYISQVKPRHLSPAIPPLSPVPDGGCHWASNIRPLDSKSPDTALSE